MIGNSGKERVKEMISKGVSGKLRDDLIATQEKLERKVEKVLFDYSSLAEVFSAINSTIDLGEVLRLIAKKTATLCGVSRCSIFLLDDMGEKLELTMSQMASGKSNKGSSRVFKKMADLEIENVDRISFFKEVIRDRKSSVLVDVGEFGPVFENWVKRFGSKSFLALPMISVDKVMGMMILDYLEEDRDFTEDQIRLAATIAGQASPVVENAKLYEQVRILAKTDSLTKLYNNRQFYESLSSELKRSARYGHFLSLIMLDVDHFKKYNDSFGHLQGDVVLKEIARILLDNLRNSDIAARYGGEEMVIILPETFKEKAVGVAQRIRKNIQEYSFPGSGGEAVRVTVSLGIATYPDDADSVMELIRESDRALYQAKREGRNRVCAA
jgi:diguanylate cyclase (GGDEF)-like protein